MSIVPPNLFSIQPSQKATRRYTPPKKAGELKKKEEYTNGENWGINIKGKKGLSRMMLNGDPRKRAAQ